MVGIRYIVQTQDFESKVKKIKHNELKERVKKQIVKIVENPRIGKPLRYDLKGEWTVYVKPFRILYKVEGETLILLRFEHRKDVYKR